MIASDLDGGRSDRGHQITGSLIASDLDGGLPDRAWLKKRRSMETISTMNYEN